MPRDNPAGEYRGPVGGLRNPAFGPFSLYAAETIISQRQGLIGTANHLERGIPQIRAKDKQAAAEWELARLRAEIRRLEAAHAP